ncbi:MAG: hypothetical protein ABL907_23035 [Hyphomicrobium sp.]
MHSKLIATARSILDGELSGAGATAALGSFISLESLNSEQATLLHLLQHFIADDDIRTDDANYAAWQRAQVLKALSAFENSQI